jgi:DNA-binding NarL/FixJ family response regulator
MDLSVSEIDGEATRRLKELVPDLRFVVLTVCADPPFVLLLPGEVAAPRRPSVNLTPREANVLSLLVEGRSYKQIAGDLVLSVDTVRTYIRGLYRKLQVQNATAAVTRALREGLV